MFHSIYKNKKVFVTGHTGFKGSWLSLWLTKLGANVCGYSLAPGTHPSMFEELHIADQITQSVIGNILDEHQLETTLKSFQPDIVFHLAAQPIVRLSYSQPIFTYKTNVLGTLNVLEYARQCSTVKAFVNVTSDKCYENTSNEHKYREEDALGGHDMYASSKGCVEIMSSSFRRSFLQAEHSMALATARAGNVIGGGDWAPDRLIPDCIRAIVGNTSLEIRNPLSIRPWQYVLEPLSGYLLLGQKLLEEGKKYATSFNFGPSSSEPPLTVTDIVHKMETNFGKKIDVLQQAGNLHEDNLLLLDIKKANHVLGWTPTYTINQALTKTAQWYKCFYQKNIDMLTVTTQQIDDYGKQIQEKYD